MVKHSMLPQWVTISFLSLLIESKEVGSASWTSLGGLAYIYNVLFRINSVIMCRHRTFATN